MSSGTLTAFKNHRKTADHAIGVSYKLIWWLFAVQMPIYRARVLSNTKPSSWSSCVLPQHTIMR